MADLFVVGVDHSETSKRAARAAATLAANAGASLHVVTAFSHHGTQTIGQGSDSSALTLAEEAKALVDGVAADLASTVRTITTASALGKPHEVILEEAERRGATLIVVGNRGMQGIGRVLGSVANTIAHHAPCDVYIVKTV
jgi:nucleotide-binding universal stress UspA family protein